MFIRYILLTIFTLSSPFAHSEGFMDLIKERQKHSNENYSEEETDTPAPSHKKEKKKKKKKVSHHDTQKRDVASVKEGGNTEGEAEEKAEANHSTPEVAKSADGTDLKTTIRLRVQDSCFTITFPAEPGKVLSCAEAVHVEYTQRGCQDKKTTETGEADAAVSCEDRKSITLRFRTSDKVIYSKMKITREPRGRAGTVAKYRVVDAKFDSGSYQTVLPAAKITAPDGKKEEAIPLRFKFSGFAWLEYERTRRFGYDAGQTVGTGLNQSALPNFQGSPTNSNFSFFSNLNFEVAKDRTSLVSILEIGEIYFGNSTSGGQQGARAGNIIEVRNIYLNHEFNDTMSAKGGIVTTASDPRSFIFNDHIGTLQGNYKDDILSGFFWYGNGLQNRPGAPKLKDQYFGFSGSFSPLTTKIQQHTVYFVSRVKDEDQFASTSGTTVTGTSRWYWGGATFDFSNLEPFSAQASYITNWGVFRTPNEQDDSYNAYLADLRLGYNWSGPEINFTLEGLATSGGNNVTDSSTGKQLLRRRKNFVSPVGAAYLMTIATNDGVDDAPGTPKQSTIANLNLDEGLRMVVFTSAFNVNKKISAFLRYGYLTSAERSSNNSKDYGQEMDLGAVYQATPTSTLQLDVGVFKPGHFFVSRASADLFALKYKFSF